MKVFLSDEATKQYSKLTINDKSKIDKKLLLLESNPLEGKKLSGQLAGTRSLKAWPYRIIYFIDKSRNEIWIASILHRQGAYK